MYQFVAIYILWSLAIRKHSLCGHNPRKGIIAHFELYF